MGYLQLGGPRDWYIVANLFMENLEQNVATTAPPAIKPRLETVRRRCPVAIVKGLLTNYGPPK